MNKYSIFDAHCDTLCRLCDEAGTILENTYNVDVAHMSKYKSYTQIFACFIAPKYHSNAKARFKQLKDCYNSSDFSGIKPMFSLEGGEVIESLEDVFYLKECGVRCATLTWNDSNSLAGGVLGDGGLSEFGKSVVRKMNDLDILVDVSHLNDQSFYDVARISTKPIIATHSSSRRLCENPRNITDEMFKIISESGGCVGVNFYPMFITGNETCKICDVINHIEHFMSLDCNSVGLGSDFDGTDDCLPNGIGGTGDVYKIFDELIKRGTDIKTIEKISHENFERVFGEVR